MQSWTRSSASSQSILRTLPPLNRWAGAGGNSWARCAARRTAPAFVLERKIEVESLRQVLHEFDVPSSADELVKPIFAHWQRPGAYADAIAFLSQLHAPLCIVSNVDDADLHSAMSQQGWSFAHVVTSEQCRAYKPRPEMFQCALQILGLQPRDVLHVGDSASSDIAGCARHGH